MILLLILLLLIFGGGGYHYGGPALGVPLIAILILVIAVVYFRGRGGDL